MRRFGVLAWSAVAVALGCRAAEADPEAVAAVKRQLLAPFETKREVLADELEIVMTANFDPELVRRINSAIHEVKREPGPDGGTVYRYSHGAPEAMVSPMYFRIGQTTLAALRSATVTILGGRSDFTLTAAAHGNVVVVAGGADQAVREVRIENGSYRAR